MRTLALLFAVVVPLVTSGCGESATAPGHDADSAPPASGKADWAELRPEIHVDPRDHTKRWIEFDVRTYRFFREHGLDAFAAAVETHPVRDPRSGGTEGLRITSLAPGLDRVFDLREGDVIVSVNGVAITSRAQAIKAARSRASHAVAKVVLRRKGKRRSIRIDTRDPHVRRGKNTTTLAHLEPELLVNPRDEHQSAIILGLREFLFFEKHGIAGLADAVRTRPATRAAGEATGLEVVSAGWEIEDAFGLREGDVIVSINGAPVTSRAEALRLARAHDPAKLARVILDRQGERRSALIDVRDPRIKRRRSVFSEED